MTNSSMKGDIERIRYINSAGVFMLGNNFRNVEAFLSSQSIMVKGSFSLVNMLEFILDQLVDYDLNPEIHEEIRDWINSLNKRYIDSGFSETYAKIPVNEITLVQHHEIIYLSLDDARILLGDIRRWKNLIPISLENEFYGLHKIRTSFMDKNKLLIGVEEF